MDGRTGMYSRSEDRPILVTGSHRSGSTWVGRMIAASDEVGYIHEPFHPNHRPGVCSAETDRFFLYAPGAQEEQWRSALHKTLSFQYDFSAELQAISSLKDVLRMVRDASIFRWHRALGRRPLMKDPIALLSADWIYENFNPKVVVLVRHPAAFAGSLKRLGWDFPFDHLLFQDRLIEERLSSFRDKIANFRGKNRDVVSQSALLWCIFCSVIKKYKNKYSNKWLFVRHEDICKDPIGEYGQIYDFLGLSFTTKARRKIKSHSYRGNTNEVQEGEVHKIKRNSKAVVHQWKNRLTEEEVERVREETSGYWEEFYSEKEW